MRFVRYVLRTLCALLLTLAAVDVLVRLTFPALPRLDENYSAAYLERAIDPTRIRGAIAFLGDSVLWGYRLPADRSAAVMLTRRGVPVENLAFEGGSMANTYALLQVMRARGARPKEILFNVNLKVFNPQDSAYRTLYPALAQLAWPLLSASDRQLLSTPIATTRDGVLDHALSRGWALYGLRADLREIIWKHRDAVSAAQDMLGEISGRNVRARSEHVATTDRFLGTYDLTPLDQRNTEVVFLEKAVALLRAWHVPTIAMLTPTNHALLREYIDVPEYDEQLRYVRRILSPAVRVLDYDRSFPASEFLDNDHLTAAGNARLARMLQTELAR